MENKKIENQKAKRGRGRIGKGSSPRKEVPLHKRRNRGSLKRPFIEDRNKVWHFHQSQFDDSLLFEGANGLLDQISSTTSSSSTSSLSSRSFSYPSLPPPFPVSSNNSILIKSSSNPSPSSSSSSSSTTSEEGSKRIVFANSITAEASSAILMLNSLTIHSSPSPTSLSSSPSPSISPSKSISPFLSPSSSSADLMNDMRERDQMKMNVNHYTVPNPLFSPSDFLSNIHANSFLSMQNKLNYCKGNNDNERMENEVEEVLEESGYANQLHKMDVNFICSTPLC